MDRAKTLAWVTAACILAACSEKKPTLVVGSKNFTEQLVLGEILAQHLENRLHTPVDRRLDLGGTLLAHESLVSGEIDLYPEYTGTALMAILKLPVESDPAVAYERVKTEYRNRFRLEWLPPLGFNNSFVMVVRGDDARSADLETLSDAARYEKGWTLGAGYEFQTRLDGFPALMRKYRISWTAAPKMMDLGLLYKALEQQQVSMIAANATDGILSKLDVKVLEDDKSAFPPYQAAVVVRAGALGKFPGLRQALEELSGKIPSGSMQDLNHQVDAGRRPLAAVAGDFLQGAGLQSTASR